jgi:hypothetical protein
MSDPPIVPIDRLIELLDDPAVDTANTSMRLPRTLRDAAALAIELGAAPSTTALTAMALRSALEAFVMQSVLDDHYREFPEARPSLADLAVAAAELDGHPLAARPELLRRAAAEIVEWRPDAEPRDVILWAEAQSRLVP